MIEELVSNNELAERIAIRRSRDVRGGERKRINCKRCRRKIPESRRRDALFCSKRCCNNYAWEERTKLRTEIRTEVRLMLQSVVCQCGNNLNNTPGRHGPLAKWCGKRCRDNHAQRQYKLRQKLKNQTEAAACA